MVTKVGDRVGAILSATEDEVLFLGWGIYKGSNDSPVGRNPEILLDNGSTVRGYQCWWGSEAEIQPILEGKVVKVVGLDGKPLPAAN